MTHQDIYTKFLIEYDKADVTSSYPSLTKYEIATILDKSYNAVISQKLTGNNIRRSTLESDIKSVSDIQPLIKTQSIQTSSTSQIGSNVISGDLPADFLYYVTASMSHTTEQDPYDKSQNRKLAVRLVPHAIAQNFISTQYNMPWVKEPVCYIESNRLYIVYDPINAPQTTSAELTYIKTPASFVSNINNDQTLFECNAVMAEEVINQAIIFALENVESTRLNTKLNTRGLES